MSFCVWFCLVWDVRCATIMNCEVAWTLPTEFEHGSRESVHLVLANRCDIITVNQVFQLFRCYVQTVHACVFAGVSTRTSKQTWDNRMSRLSSSVLNVVWQFPSNFSFWFCSAIYIAMGSWYFIVMSGSSRRIFEVLELIGTNQTVQRHSRSVGDSEMLDCRAPCGQGGSKERR